MMYTNVHSGLLHLVHALGALCLFVGLVFLLAWAIKHLSEKRLRYWGWVLVLIGLAVCFLTLVAGRSWKDGKGMMQKNVGMMQHQQGAAASKGMPMEMSMAQMTRALQGKTADDFDRQFISDMIIHHQGAIDMAKLAQTSAKHAEIKKLATAIITAQQKEIDQMKQWQKTWGYVK